VSGAVEPWTFGVAPLPQTREVAVLLRRVASLALALEADDPALARLAADLGAAVGTLTDSAPADLRPRIGPDATVDQRVYIDHSRDIGSFNPAFPEYTIVVEGPRAHGDVTFPVVYEGPPGMVHGGVLGTFFDSVAQHHNCAVGTAGKTISMLVEYRRPTPLLTALRFEIDRDLESSRIVSRARLYDEQALLCSATVTAVAGDPSALPAVSPRRVRP
jgi:acyl-coenzyme A thioesterase PaaI-like protein